MFTPRVSLNSSVLSRSQPINGAYFPRSNLKLSEKTCCGAKLTNPVGWYHSGSAALGSLLVAIMQFIRILVAYAVNQLKSAGKGRGRPMNTTKVTRLNSSCFKGARLSPPK